MCEQGNIIESQDEHGRQVMMCMDCGNVFVVIHACANHLIVEAVMSEVEQMEAFGEVLDEAVVIGMGDIEKECAEVNDSAGEKASWN